MESKQLNKLQIRAKILSLLQDHSKLSEQTSEEIDKILEQLRSISDRKSVIEILLKELIKHNEDKVELIAILLIEISELSDLNDSLWEYIKGPQYSDNIKEISSNILRAMGEKITTESITDYLNNPEEIIDRETQKLLETAKVNPEAQIDFLDFLHALAECEQLQLISSLQDDYESADLLNIVTPIIYSDCSDKVKESIIKLMGETKSYYALSPLKDIVDFTKNQLQKKAAKKSLTMLKLAGICEENQKFEINKNHALNQHYKIYECYSSIIDGVGNQGLIISRIDNNEFIFMYSVVINDKEGIIDCFGFSSITKNEFEKIIKRFSKETKVIKVPAEYAKRSIRNAQLINKRKDMNIPYEFTCWDILTSDINIRDQVEDKYILNGQNVDLLKNYKEILYKENDFSTWFLDEQDSKEVEEFLVSTIETIMSIYDPSNIDWLKLLDNILMKNYALFNENIINTLLNRLDKNTELLNINNETEYRNTLATISYQLSTSPEKSEFLKDVLKRSIVEKLLREKEKAEKQNKTTNFFSKNVKEEPLWNIDKINNTLAIIKEIWS